METTALVQHHLGMAAVRTLYEDVLPVLTVEWVSEQTHKAAVETVLTASRQKLSLVDCVSFQIMRAAPVHSASCFDKHFHEQGFVTVP